MCIGCHNIPGLPGELPRGLQGAQDRRPERASTSSARWPRTARASASTRRCARSPAASPTRTSPISRPSTPSSARAPARRPRRRPPVPRRAAPTRRRPAVAKLLATANCVSCHGANFASPIDPSYPKLAGQHADYLYHALRAYQVDHNPLVGRSNAIMMGMARPFTHPEIKAIAAYLSSLPGDLQTVAQSRFSRPRPQSARHRRARARRCRAARIERLENGSAAELAEHRGEALADERRRRMHPVADAASGRRPSRRATARSGC